MLNLRQFKTRFVFPVTLACVSVLAVTGCLTPDDAEISASDEQASEAQKEANEKAAAESVLEQLQGTWSIDVDASIATASDYSEREKEIARGMLQSMNLNVDGTTGRMTAEVLGNEQDQEWELSVEDVSEDGKSFTLCVLRESSSEPDCNDSSFTERGFKTQNSDGLTTFYVPAEEEEGSAPADETAEDGDTEAPDDEVEGADESNDANGEDEGEPEDDAVGAEGEAADVADEPTGDEEKGSE
jgi:hypothetical protein